MDLKALFQISHGVYLTGARDIKNRLIGSCIDSVMVVEVEPAQVLVSLGKQSYTCENVLKNKRLTLSVLDADTSDEVIERFGMQSSRVADKWIPDSFELIHDLPVFKSAVAIMELKVVEVKELQTHFVFLCEVVEVKRGTMKEPLLYNNYQKRKEQKMTGQEKWVCSVCGYVYEGEIPFEELPEDWVCPVCGEPKSVFVKG